MAAHTTPLYQLHLQHQAKMLPFAGWLMPIHYGSQLEEHLQVRMNAGMFDVSHMGIIDLEGKDARAFLRYLLANDVAKLEAKGIGKALYSVMLNESAGIIDDLIVYLMPGGYRLVVNASTRDRDLASINQHAQNFQVQVIPRHELAIIAVQGPKALASVSKVKPEWAPQLASLAPFQAFVVSDGLIARTGYTGEDGVEIMCLAHEATLLWQALNAQGVKPCGLGARDTLRIEAGFNLYGQDMDETTHPYECGLASAIDLKDPKRYFCGKNALLNKIDQGLAYRQAGLILEDKGILRAGLKLINHEGLSGVVTSGSYSPSLKLSIGIARVPMQSQSEVQVELRGELKRARMVKLPFIKHGASVFTTLNP